MEVHHHSHTARKKWTHFLWEFLMLFLAVFCGFLAENQREHYVEHQREKQFMKSLTEDLERDTLELQKAIKVADIVAHYSDSVVVFLRSYKPTNGISAWFAYQVGKSGQIQTLINTDRTSSQLKNSGGMRLVRNKIVSNKILEYWNQIGETNISLDRYMRYRNASRELVFRLWVIPEVYLVGETIARDSMRFLQQQLRIIDPEPKKWDEFNNLTAIAGFISRGTHSKNLKLQYKMACELITILRKEYHF